MTKYREILRLSGLGLSQQNIANSCNVSKKTVNRVLRQAKELNISWPLGESDTDAVLAEKFFPSAKKVSSNKRMPDYAWNVVRSNATFNAYYNAKRAEGQSHYNALGHCAGKLIRVIWKMLTDEVEFNLE